MAVCLKPMQQPDGSVLLAVDPLPQDFATCTYVVESGSEVANGLMSMSAQDGAEASAMIIGLWFAAYGIRSVINLVRGNSE